MARPRDKANLHHEHVDRRVRKGTGSRRVWGGSSARDYDAQKKTLRVGEGVFAPVAPAVMEFSVSGFKVVDHWLKARTRKGVGKQKSPLDKIRPEKWTAQFTRELLELLWVL